MWFSLLNIRIIHLYTAFIFVMNKQIVLITGGSSGIGKSIGTLLKQKNFIVYGTTRSLEKHPNFNTFKLLEIELKDKISVVKGVQHIIDREGRLDILINNAGVGIIGAIEETLIDQIEHAFDVNLKGAIRMIQAVLPQMRHQKSGLIINNTSIASYMGLPYRGVYSASKGALKLITEALSMEVKNFGVKVVNLAPGDFATNIAANRYHVPVNKNSSYPKYNQLLQLIDKHQNNAKNPDQVAYKVYKIIQQKHPKINYKAGAFAQRFSIILKNILPSKWYEYLLLKYYKL